MIRSTSESSSIKPIDSPAQATPSTTRRLDRRFVTAALMLVMVLASMEMTVTSTAMPTIIGELHGLEHYAWVASVFMLALTVSQPLYGRMSDALGRKRVIVFAIILFCAASTLAAFARSMTQLIVFRGFQGLGAGGIMPVVLTILGDIFTLEERARIQGFFSAVWGIASLAGPALGALLVNTLGWRWVFLVNLPFGMLGLVVLMWKYHDVEQPHPTDLNLPGILSLAIACTAILALVSRLGPDGWSLPFGVALSAIAIVTLGFFIRHERRARHPIFPPSVIFSRAVGPSLLGTLFFGAGVLCLDTYVPLYVQGGRGGGATAAASVVTPVLLTWAVSGIVVAPLLVRFGFRATALAGASCIVLGFTGLFFCAITQAPHWIITAVLLLTGIGFSATSMSYLLAAQDAVGWQQRGVVTASVGFVRSIGGALGVGLLGGLFNILIAGDLARFRSDGIAPAELLDPSTYAKLSAGSRAALQQTITHGLLWVFGAMVVLAIAQVLATTSMRRRTCAHPVRAAEAVESLAT